MVEIDYNTEFKKNLWYSENKSWRERESSFLQCLPASKYERDEKI